MKKLPRSLILSVSSALLLLVFILSIRFGSVRLSVADVLNGIFTGDGKAGIIVRHLRLPRAVASLLSGAALAVSGSLLQSSSGNGLTSPSTVGINAGAGAAVMLSLCIFPMSFASESAFAFLGAMLAAAITLGLAKRQRGGLSRVRVVLAGVAVGSIFSALTSFLALRYPDALPSYTAFSVGGYAGVYFKDLFLPSLVIAPMLVMSIILAPRLNVLALGDELARSMGVRTGALRAVSVTVAAALASASVAFAGLVGFVGLIAPHVASRLIGSDERFRIPLAALVGAMLTTLADLLGRVLFTPTELPSGILLNLIGAPFFLCILLLDRREERV